MIDFKCTEKGDICLKNNDFITKRINFYITETCFKKINFVLSCKTMNHNAQYKISFIVDKDINSVSATTINNSKADMQYVSNCIKTSLNNLKDNKSFGSKIDMYRHKEYDNKAVITSIETEITRILENVDGQYTFTVEEKMIGYESNIIVNIKNYYNTDISSLIVF